MSYNGRMTPEQRERKNKKNREYMARQRATPEGKAKLNAASNKSHGSVVPEIRNLLGDKCVICGTDENLEIDHIDGRGRELRLTQGPMNHYRSIRNGLREGKNIYNVRLLCHTCHVAQGRHGRPGSVMLAE